MRFSTVFISSAFVLASLSVALPLERGNMLVTRFADSGFLAEVEVRAYGEEPELYAREHHRLYRDHPTSTLYDDVPLTPGTHNPPNLPDERTASTHGPSLHRHLRTYVSRNQVEARAYDEEPEPPTGNHRDYDTTKLYPDGSFTPTNPHSNQPNQRTASTHGHPRLY